MLQRGGGLLLGSSLSESQGWRDSGMLDRSMFDLVHSALVLLNLVLGGGMVLMANCQEGVSLLSGQAPLYHAVRLVLANVILLSTTARINTVLNEDRRLR